MKSKLKSVFMMLLSAAPFCGVAVMLTACDDLDTPHIFGANAAEVPSDILDQPRIVAQPSAALAADRTYPRLGDVPGKPNDFSSLDDLDKQVRQMESDRSEGQKLKYDYENPAIEAAPETPVSP